MHQLLNSAINYLHHHPHMGILFAFVVALLESLPIIGTIIPGSITMTAVGAMIGAGLIPGYLTLAIASAGAFLGDIIGFTSGRVFKDKIRDVWPFRKHPKIISVCETFILKHGGKSILIGRFVGAVRSAIPMVAGLLHLSWFRFIIAALPTAILWAIVYSLPGILLGAFSMEIPPKQLTEYIVIGVAIIVALWFIYWLIQRSFRSITTFYHRQIDRYWDSLEKRRASNLIIKLIYNRQAPDCHFQLSRLIICLVSLILCAVVFITIALQSGLMSIDQPLFHLAQSTRIYHLDAFFITLTLFGKPAIVMFIAFVISLGLIFTSQWRASTTLCFTTIFTAAIVYAIRLAHFSPRPPGFMIVSHASSLPSGHATISLVVYGLLAFFTGQRFKNHRGIIYTITGVLIALISISRLYLGAHWFTDIIASIFLGLTILLLAIISYQRLPNAHSALSLSKWAWLTCMLIVVFATWAGNVYFSYHIARYRYTPFYKKVTISKHAWWKTPLKFTPIYRLNRFGKIAQPLNIQWAGNLKHIEKTLTAHHWHYISRHQHVKDTIQRLSSDKPQYHLPVFESLYHNKPPAAIYYKAIPHQKAVYVLRLWNSHIAFHDHSILWIGMLNQLNPPHKFMTFAHRNLMSFAKLHTAATLYGKSPLWKDKAITVDARRIPHQIEHYQWDGKVWLIQANE